jgi:pimeloyl-ACP methyl ester carboxylesterase
LNTLSGILREGGKVTTLFVILALIIACLAAMVTLSFSLGWYEYANRDPALLETRFAPKSLAMAIFLIATETACLLLTLLLHPFGWFNFQEKSPPTPSRPIILLHGLFQSRTCWVWLKLALRRKGFAALYTLKLPPWKDVESLTEDLAKRVDELRHATGLQKVHLIGHSMGGIIARNYLQIRGGSDKVDCCVLLATPNQGSKLAPFSLSPLGCLMMPGSAFLQRLAAAALPDNARIITIYSRHDNIVVPFENARLEGARNIELTRSGHMSLLFRPGMASLLAGLLEEPSP